MSEPDHGWERPGKTAFATTQWTLVLEAAHGSSERRRSALEGLAQAYWPPLYAWIRQQGHPPIEAQDLTQEFFCRLLQRDWLADLKPEEGKFRSFLLASARNFLTDQFRRRHAQKRGGGVPVLSLDWKEGEALAARIASAEETPDQAFDRLWALRVLDRALRRLAAEASSSGKTALFGRLRAFFSSEPVRGECEAIAEATGLTANYVSVQLLRWRRRLRDLTRQELAETVLTPAMVEEEYDNLLAALRRS